MAKTVFFSQKRVAVISTKFHQKLTFTKMTLFICGRSDAARQADSEYQLSLPSKRNMGALNRIFDQKL